MPPRKPPRFPKDLLRDRAVKLSISMPNSKLNELEAYSRANDITMSEFARNAIARSLREAERGGRE